MQGREAMVREALGAAVQQLAEGYFLEFCVLRERQGEESDPDGALLEVGSCQEATDPRMWNVGISRLTHSAMRYILSCEVAGKTEGDDSDESVSRTAARVTGALRVQEKQVNLAADSRLLQIDEANVAREAEKIARAESELRSAVQSGQLVEPELSVAKVELDAWRKRHGALRDEIAARALHLQRSTFNDTDTDQVR